MNECARQISIPSSPKPSLFATLPPGFKFPGACSDPSCPNACWRNWISSIRRKMRRNVNEYCNTFLWRIFPCDLVASTNRGPSNIRSPNRCCICFCCQSLGRVFSKVGTFRPLRLVVNRRSRFFSRDGSHESSRSSSSLFCARCRRLGLG